MLLEATRIGYQPLLLQATIGPETGPLLLQLTPAVLQLKEMTVTPGACRWHELDAVADWRVLKN